MIRSVSICHLCAALAACGQAQSKPTETRGPADLITAYPGMFRSIDASAITLADGTRLSLSDGRGGKTPAERLTSPDIGDMFAQPYRPGPPTAPPATDDDPGRVRYQPLFVAMYGDCTKGQVAPKMRSVAWIGRGSLMVTTVNGVADRLEQVIAELRRLPPSLTRYLVPAGGTYNCRRIAGTEQLSMHAFGAAIDIATGESDYWRWAGKRGYRNRIPWEIVAIFERHGFIWGGKWSHFDTMHFEYRPELLPPAR
ncbi:MAG: M15 family metallopeptidase [Pseudomonadota bacterium]